MRTPTRSGQGRIAIVIATAVVVVIVIVVLVALRRGGGSVQSLAVVSPPSSPGASATATAPGTASPTADGTVLFTDDFSNPSSGWAPDPGQAGAGSGAYVSGGYQVLVNRSLPSLNTFSIASPYSLRRPSVSATATMIIAAGAPADGGGVRCDQQGRQGLRYTFETHGDGSWVLFKLDTNVTAALAQGSNPAVLTGIASNTIQGSCTETTGGTSLRMVVNGVELARVLDAHPQIVTWHTALVAYRSGTQATILRFNHFQVRIPPP